MQRGNLGTAKPPFNRSVGVEREEKGGGTEWKLRRWPLEEVDHDYTILTHRVNK